MILQARLYHIFALVRRTLGLDGNPLYTLGIPTPNQEQQTSSRPRTRDRPRTRERSRTYDRLRTVERPHTSGDRSTLTPSFNHDLVPATTTTIQTANTESSAIDPHDLFNPFGLPTRKGVPAVHPAHRPLGPAPRVTRKVRPAETRDPPSPVFDGVLRNF